MFYNAILFSGHFPDDSITICLIRWYHPVNIRSDVSLINACTESIFSRHPPYPMVSASQYWLNIYIFIMSTHKYPTQTEHKHLWAKDYTQHCSYNFKVCAASKCWICIYLRPVDVRDIHKYFLFFIISFLSILVLTNIPTKPLDTCLEMVLRSATILLHNLVRKVLVSEPPNTELQFELPRGVSTLLPH